MTKNRKRTSRPKNERKGDRRKLSRQTYDLHWLDISTSKVGNRPFEQLQGNERDGQREAVQPFLSEAVVDHHISRMRISACLQDLGHLKAAAFFAHEMPRNARTRKGNFGEVVASEHLIQRYGYSMPVYKLRHRDSHLPMRGEDIVAFELNEERHIVRLIIGEAKAVRSFRRGTVTDAHDRLKSAFNPRPMTLSMLSNILYERGDDALGAQVDRVSFALLENGFPRSNWIFLINESQPDDPFAVLADNDEVVGDLICLGIKLGDFDGLVEALFDEAPERMVGRG